jgi:hypothetical protein
VGDYLKYMLHSKEKDVATCEPMTTDHIAMEKKVANILLFLLGNNL